MKKEQIKQEEEYDFPYHYSVLMEEHRGIPYNLVVSQIIVEIKNLRQRTVADVGCGDGYLIYKAKKEIKNIEGYDYSDRAIGFAKAFNPKAKFYIQDITKKELVKKYDLIILQDIIEHVEKEKLKILIRNITKSLNKNGKIVLTVPTDNLPVSKKHFQHFNIKKIEELFNQYKIEKYYYLNSKSRIKNFIYKFLLWKCYCLYPLKVSKLKSIYSAIQNTTKNYYKSLLLKAKQKTGKRLLVILKS